MNWIYSFIVREKGIRINMKLMILTINLVGYINIRRDLIQSFEKKKVFIF